MKFTLCGSARFEKEYHFWNKKLGLMGHISYSLMTFPSIEGSNTWYTEDEKELLDLAHLAKIEESDAILVLNKDGYIGPSTKREILWATMRHKLVFWLEDEHGNVMNMMSNYHKSYPVSDLPDIERFLT